MYAGFSRTQKCVTLLTFEAKYVAQRGAVNELVFLRQVWLFILPGNNMSCFPVFEDSQSAVQLAQSPVMTSNSKHIDVRHNFFREYVRQRDVTVLHVSSGFSTRGYFD